MKKKVVFMVLMILISALSHGEPLYRSERSPLKNFMKFAAEYDKTDFTDAMNVPFYMGKVNDKEKYFGKVRKIGKIFWDKHEKDLLSIIDNWEEIINTSLQLCEPDKVDTTKTTPDITFCRQYSYMLSAVIEYLIGENRPEEALKLSALLYKFGQIMMTYDGDCCSFLTLTLGGVIARNAVTPNLGHALLSPKLSGDFLKKFEKLWDKMLSDKVDIKLAFDTEVFIGKNTTLKEAWEKSSEDTLKKFGGLTSAGELNKGWTRVNECLDTIIREYYQMFEKTRKLPTHRNFDRAMRRYLERIDSIAEEPPSDMDTYLVHAHKLFRLAAPNYGAYPSHLKNEYTARGISILAKAVINEKHDSAEELKRGIEKYLTVDDFSEDREKFIIKQKGSEIQVYSLGFNGCDDEGYEPNDFSVIRISYEK